MIRRIIAIILIVCFSLGQTGFAQVAPQFIVPAYIQGVLPQDRFRPIQLRSLSFDPVQNNFNLLLDTGNLAGVSPLEIDSSTKTLLEYFKIGLALPNSKFWVNLRPDAPGDIIDPLLEKTDIGKILLEADLQLKKDVAAFTSPDTDVGKQYWKRLYQKIDALYGPEEDVEIPTMTRPWIVPGEIILGQNNDRAYIYKAALKVMLEQDYLKGAEESDLKDPRARELNEYSSQLVRELIIPQLTREVNSGKKYSGLRQVYYSLILAQWFKAKPQVNALTGMIDSKNLTGITSKENWSKKTYFNEYRRSLADGEYKREEEVGTGSKIFIHRYFSGGIIVPDLTFGAKDGGSDVTVLNGLIPDQAGLKVSVDLNADRISQVPINKAALDGGNNSDQWAQKHYEETKALYVKYWQQVRDMKFLKEFNVRVMNIRARWAKGRKYNGRLATSGDGISAVIFIPRGTPLHDNLVKIQNELKKTEAYKHGKIVLNPPDRLHFTISGLAVGKNSGELEGKFALLEKVAQDAMKEASLKNIDLKFENDLGISPTARINIQGFMKNRSLDKIREELDKALLKAGLPEGSAKGYHISLAAINRNLKKAEFNQIRDVIEGIQSKYKDNPVGDLRAPVVSLVYHHNDLLSDVSREKGYYLREDGAEYTIPAPKDQGLSRGGERMLVIYDDKAYTSGARYTAEEAEHYYEMERRAGEIQNHYRGSEIIRSIDKGPNGELMSRIAVVIEQKISKLAPDEPRPVSYIWDDEVIFSDKAHYSKYYSAGADAGSDAALAKITEKARDVWRDNPGSDIVSQYIEIENNDWSTTTETSFDIRVAVIKKQEKNDGGDLENSGDAASKSKNWNAIRAKADSGFGSSTTIYQAVFDGKQQESFLSYFQGYNWPRNAVFNGKNTIVADLKTTAEGKKVIGNGLGELSVARQYSQNMADGLKLTEGTYNLKSLLKRNEAKEFLHNIVITSGGQAQRNAKYSQIGKCLAKIPMSSKDRQEARYILDALLDIASNIESNYKQDEFMFAVIYGDALISFDPQKLAEDLSDPLVRKGLACLLLKLDYTVAPAYGFAKVDAGKGKVEMFQEKYNPIKIDDKGQIKSNVEEVEAIREFGTDAQRELLVGLLSGQDITLLNAIFRENGSREELMHRWLQSKGYLTPDDKIFMNPAFSVMGIDAFLRNAVLAGVIDENGNLKVDGYGKVVFAKDSYLSQALGGEKGDKVNIDYYGDIIPAFADQSPNSEISRIVNANGMLYAVPLDGVWYDTGDINGERNINLQEPSTSEIKDTYGLQSSVNSKTIVSGKEVDNFGMDSRIEAFTGLVDHKSLQVDSYVRTGSLKLGANTQLYNLLFKNIHYLEIADNYVFTLSTLNRDGKDYVVPIIWDQRDDMKKGYYGGRNEGDKPDTAVTIAEWAKKSELAVENIIDGYLDSQDAEGFNVLGKRSQIDALPVSERKFAWRDKVDLYSARLFPIVSVESFNAWNEGKAVADEKEARVLNELPETLRFLQHLTGSAPQSYMEAVKEGRVASRSDTYQNQASQALYNMRNEIKNNVEAANKDGGVGGIDFRALPLSGTAMPAFVPLTPKAMALANASGTQELDKEWLKIGKELSMGRVPYNELKDYAAACRKRQDTSRQIEELQTWVNNILSLEEAAAVPTSREMKEILSCLS